MTNLKDNWAWLLLLAVIVFGVYAYTTSKGTDIAYNAEKELEVENVDAVDASSTDEVATTSEDVMDDASSTDEMADKEDEMEDKMEDDMMDKEEVAE